MATRAVFTPFSAEFPTSNFPQLALVNARPVLAFDQTTAETCYWTDVAPQGLTGTLTAVISYIATVNSGTAAFDVAIEAISSGDTIDLDTSTSFGTANSSSAQTVPGTAGYMSQISVTLTNTDSLAAADYFRLSLQRNTGLDTAAGDVQVLAVELRDGA